MVDKSENVNPMFCICRECLSKRENVDLICAINSIIAECNRRNLTLFKLEDATNQSLHLGCSGSDVVN